MCFKKNLISLGNNKNKKMRLINNLNSNLKINLIINIIIIFAFIVIGTYIYFYEKQKLIYDNEVFMQEEIRNYEKILKYQTQLESDKILSAINTFDYFIKEKYVLEIGKNVESEIQAINIQTFETEIININPLLLNYIPLYKNNIIVDKIYAITNAFAAIYQKTPIGYLTVSSNLIDNKSKNTINYFIPISSEIIYSIEKGEIYVGEENYFNNDYIVAAKPVYVNGVINGMICIYYKDDVIKNIKSFFEGKYYYQNGYPFVINTKGIIKIHPTLENESIATTKLFEKFAESKTTKDIINFQYYFPENSDILKNAHVKYNSTYDLYIGTTYTQSDFQKQLNKLGITLFIVIFIAGSLVIIIFTYFFRSLLKRFTVIGEKLYDIARGEKKQKFVITKRDELYKINDGTNQIIEYLDNIEKMCADIKNNDYDENTLLIQDNDKILSTLQDLKKELKAKKYEEEKRKKESDIKQWANSGIAKFIDIVRLNNDNINKLSYAVISNVVKYLNVIQGALYLVSEDEKNLILNSCYAYNKQRMITKEIPVKSGLLGRVVKEKKYLYITDIPKDYLIITSGLGQTPPRYLLICPLIFDNNVLGIIEIAGLNPFEEYQIEFLEEIGESIALTISNLKINQRTENLLRKSQDQSRIVEEQKLEMQKNIQQLHLLKEETDRREVEIQNIFKAINSTALVAEFDIRGRIFSMNDKFLQAVNQSKDQMIGKYHKDFTIMSTDSDDYKQFWKDLSEGRTRSLIESIHFDNTTIWLSQTFTPIQEKDGAIKKILDIAIDITENKMLEKELRTQVREMNKQERQLQKEIAKIGQQQKIMDEKDNKLNLLLNSIDFSFIRIEFGIQGVILSANEKFCISSGYNINEIIGANIFDIVVKNQENDITKTINKLKNGLVIERDIEIFNNNNRISNFRTTLSPIKNEEGVVVKILLIGIQFKENEK